MTNSVHSIRLHGPWQATLLRTDHPAVGGTNGIPAIDSQTKIAVPGDWADWLGENFRGVVRYQRSFGLPTNLADNQTIWLIIEEVDFAAHVWFNGTPLGEMRLGQPSLRQPVRALMKARNCLQIDIELPIECSRGSRNQLAGGLIGEVRLEIVG